MKKKIKETKFNLRASDDFLGRLHTAAAVLDRSASQIVREAVDEKLERIAKRNPKLREALEAA